MTPPRLLLFGKNFEVMERLLRELRAAGLDATGSTDLAAATTAFDARAYDLIGFGGGVSVHERTALQNAFAAQNPSVAFVPLIAPLAVEQLVFHARRLTEAIPLVLTELRVLPGDGVVGLTFGATRPTPVTLWHYYYTPRLVARQLAADETDRRGSTYQLPTTGLPSGPHFVAVKAENGEIVVGRFDLS